jgi:HSP20 family protein
MANITRREEGRELARPGLEWDPFRMMRELLRDPFGELARLPRWEPAGFAPDFEVKETKDGYHFRADLPGVKDADLEISLTGNRLTVSGKRDTEGEKEGETYYAYERRYGSFTRTFTLPEGIDAASVKADLKDGVLTLKVPKLPELQPKKIELRTGGGKEEKKIKA